MVSSQIKEIPIVLYQWTSSKQYDDANHYW
jgi:hypothetical protein